MPKNSEQTMLRFKERALTISPNLTSVLTHDNWLTLNDNWLTFSEQFATKKRARLSKPWLLDQVSQLKKIDYSSLIAILQQKNDRIRGCKKRAASASHPIHSIKKRRFVDDEPNPFVTTLSSDASSDMHSFFKRATIRECPLSPATPTKHYQHVYKTPEKGTKVRPYFSRKGKTLFAPLTPLKRSVPNKGIISLEANHPNQIKKDLPSLSYERPQPIEFTATKTKIELRHGERRHLSQKQLTGASCREVFIAHGDKFAVEVSGNKYHWSHSIAWFLGGEQNKENLIPATAASNYNTLDIVEQFIAETLENSHCQSIQVTVSPKWADDYSLIPSQLIYNLKWQELHDNHAMSMEETIYINPCSDQRVTATMLKSIQDLRSFEDKEPSRSFQF